MINWVNTSYYKLCKEHSFYCFLIHMHTKPSDSHVVPYIPNCSFVSSSLWHTPARAHTAKKREVHKGLEIKKKVCKLHMPPRFLARVTCDLHGEGQCGQTGAWVIRRGCGRRKKGSLAHREREDKMPAKYLCSWLVASGKWDINNYDDWSTPGSGNSPGLGGRRRRFQSRLQHGLFCDLMESLWALVYKWGNNKV